MPTPRAGARIVVLRLNGPVALAWVVDAPPEDVVGRSTLALPGDRNVGIGDPINHRDDLVRRVGRDSSLIPVILHLNLKLPDEVEVGGGAIGDLDVGQTSLYGVNRIGDIVDDFYGGMGFATD